jgi:RND family efflux transporter MFP subunit
VGLVILGGAYVAYGKLKPTTTTTSYVTSPASKGTLVVSVTGTGQVSSSNQVDVKPLVSGAVTQLKIKNGDIVMQNALLASIDAGDAVKAVRDAEVNLQSAMLSLQKLKQPADSLSLLQAQGSLTSAEDALAKLKLNQATDYTTTQQDKQKASDDLMKGYEDTFTAVSDTFLDLPSIMSGLEDVMRGEGISTADTTLSAGTQNGSSLINTLTYNDRLQLQPLLDTADAAYGTARLAYDANLITYKNTSRFSSRADIEKLLTETVETTKLIAEATKRETTVLDSWVDLRTLRNATDYAKTVTKVATYRSSLLTYNSQVNSHLSTLLTNQRSLQNNKEALESAARDLSTMDTNNPRDLVAAEQAVKEKEGSLTNLKAGATDLDIAASELSVTQRRNALNDAREKLADYTIRSPLDGTVANVDVQLHGQASPSAVIATIVGKQQIAEISLNEVDAAKIAIGQKATLTFDAVDGLTIAGIVVEIDTIGTVSQGVVSYNVKIAFDTDDDRVKSGMSVSAGVITDVRQDVILVPSSAIKSQGDQFYVEELTNGVPVRIQVTTGLSNDTMTEVASGVNEGDEIVTQTITSAAAPTSSSSALGGLSLPGVTGGGTRGGAVGR